MRRGLLLSAAEIKEIEAMAQAELADIQALLERESMKAISKRALLEKRNVLKTILKTVGE
ncbi:hypothetical protein [Metabacillus sp. RGM 3146]|uniref:hypothetical protein n=1 Tax=Metabacillus sp. RGM 3146 TaxID=3401092 RepID=UPI003B9C31AE